MVAHETVVARLSPNNRFLQWHPEHELDPKANLF